MGLFDSKKSGEQTVSRVSDAVFELDTKSFETIIDESRELAEQLRTLKYDLDEAKNTLMWSWEGEARNTFEKKYRLLSQQLGDLKDDTWTIYEDIIAAEEAYIQADTNLAKMLDGKDSRY